MAARALRLLALCLAWGLACASPTPAAPPSALEAPALLKTVKERFALSEALEPSARGGLTHLLALQRAEFPSVRVSGTFYEWRVPSRARRHAGLHLGYDLAMPAGTPVRAGWGGEVAAVVPWDDQEWGVTVRSPGGVEVTYGHVTPSLRVGDVVRPGQVLGRVAGDHVDVKMRDAFGRFVDFGVGPEGSLPGALGLAPKAGGREGMLAAWLVARNGLELATEELEGRRREQAAARARRAGLAARLKALEAQIPLMDRYVAEGLVARVEAERSRGELRETRQELARVEAALASAGASASLEAQLKEATRRLARLEQQAAAQGLTWQDVTRFVNDLLRRDPRLTRQVQQFKEAELTARREARERLVREVRRGAEALAQLEALFLAGGLPSQEIQAARAQQRVREERLKALEG